MCLTFKITTFQLGQREIDRSFSTKQKIESIPDKEITVRIGDPSLLLFKCDLILYKLQDIWSFHILLCKIFSTSKLGRVNEIT